MTDMFDGNLKLMIVDDEAPARARLSAMVGEIDGWNVVAEAANGSDVLKFCEQQPPDVILLDIRMPGMDGIEVASHLCKLDTQPAIIFTTAYDEYAVRAFETHAVGYLLKPVRRERLLRALERAARVGRMQLAALTEQNPELGARKRIPVNQAGKLSLVSVEDIISFHADQKYVRMLHESVGKLSESLIDETLKGLEQEFAQEFVRIHRNSLVRVSAIETLERDAEGQPQVKLRNVAEPLAVSRRHHSELKKRLQA